ncbi:DUF1266 domain-containing protein [Bacteroides coprosuis]|uniref:DUF1266 domain-containing protein n=1 Tax=Bacteroides coprosuis TaxID=151276 RepID=UPI001E1765AD|nr:DUF1266 domain-containing protein [Bacteroides coprosuis]HJD93169.1 DUF1266 domain-containing protein [Bacteroides coprosuis]
MLNKYTSLCSVYRYTSHFEQVVDAKTIQKEFYDTVSLKDKAEEALIRKNLENIYDITDEESAIATIEDYMSNSIWLHPMFSILVDVWRDQLDVLEQDTTQIDDLMLTDEYLIEKVKSYTTDFDENDKEFIVNSVKDQLMDLLSCPESKKLFIQFFNKNEILIQLAGNYPVWGFELARLVEVMTKANDLGYLTDEQLTTYLNKVGECVESKFSSWEQFLASCALGKLYTSQNRDVKSVFVHSQEEYIKNVYGLITSPNRILLDSGLWGNSSFANIKQALEVQFHLKPVKKEYLAEYEANAQLEGQSIALFNKYLGDPLKEKGVDNYVLENWQLNNVYSAENDINDGSTFWKQVYDLKEKFDLFFSKEEIPILILGKQVITNRALYLVKRKFLKRKLETIPLPDVQFDFEVEYTQAYLKVLYKGMTLTHFQLEASRVGLERDDLFKKNKEEVFQLFEKDIQSLKDVFNSLRTIKE